MKSNENDIVTPNEILYDELEKYDGNRKERTKEGAMALLRDCLTHVFLIPVSTVNDIIDQLSAEQIDRLIYDAILDMPPLAFERLNQLIDFMEDEEAFDFDPKNLMTDEEKEQLSQFLTQLQKHIKPSLSTGEPEIDLDSYNAIDKLLKKTPLRHEKRWDSEDSKRPSKSLLRSLVKNMFAADPKDYLNQEEEEEEQTEENKGQNNPAPSNTTTQPKPQQTNNKQQTNNNQQTNKDQKKSEKEKQKERKQQIQQSNQRVLQAAGVVTEFEILDKCLLEGAVKVYRRTKSGKMATKYRCIGGAKDGMLVSDPKKCNMRKNPVRVRNARKTARYTKSKRARKSKLKRNTSVSKALAKINKLLSKNKRKKIKLKENAHGKVTVRQAIQLLKTLEKYDD
jgi:hypothetical protein